MSAKSDIVENIKTFKNSFKEPWKIIKERTTGAYNNANQKKTKAWDKATSNGGIFQKAGTIIYNIIQNYFLIFVAIIMILYIVLVRYLYCKNPYDFANKYPLWSILLSLGGSYLLIMSLIYIKDKIERKTSDTSTNYIQLMSVSLASILVVIAILQIYNVSNQFFGEYSDVSSIILVILNTLIVVGIISFLIKSIGFNNIRDKIPNKLILIYKIITYIPCLFILLIENIKKQFNITSKTTIIILVVEVFAVLLYVLIPYILKKLTLGGGTLLQTQPLYLNKKHTIGIHKDVVPGETYSYNYAISTWLYINPQPSNTSGAYTQDTSLLDYGGKPNITFNGKKNKLIIKALNNKESINVYETTDFPKQKWNHIVINYNRGTLDVFINGILVSSTKGVIPYMKYDNLIVGKESGINGGVKNTIYYERTLTKDEINNLYNFSALTL
jgi:hypothetical protein